MNEEVSIQDNFLPKEVLNTLKEEICNRNLPLSYLPFTVYEDEDPKITPGLLFHVILFHGRLPRSQLFDTLRPLILQLNAYIIYRIQINLNLRLSEPYTSPWHTDTFGFDATGWSNSVFYLNTNNGYTELEDGTKIESVANRVVTIPLTLSHRGITQTDEQTRYVINFNYLKGNLK